MVQVERAEYLWAIFTLIQGWLASGKPQGTVTEGGMRAYCQVVGGFTEAFGYGPVLANAADLTEQASHEQEELLALIHAWAARFGTDTVTAKQLAQLIADEGLVFDGLTTLHHTGVGKLVKRHRDAVLGGYQVRVTPDPSNKRSVYSLEEPSV